MPARRACASSAAWSSRVAAPIASERRRARPGTPADPATRRRRSFEDPEAQALLDAGQARDGLANVLDAPSSVLGGDHEARGDARRSPRAARFCTLRPARRTRLSTRRSRPGMRLTGARGGSGGGPAAPTHGRPAAAAAGRASAPSCPARDRSGRRAPRSRWAARPAPLPNRLRSPDAAHFRYTALYSSSTEASRCHVGQQQGLDGDVERPVHARGPRDQADAAADGLGEVAVVRPELADAAHRKLVRADPGAERAVGEDRQLGGGIVPIEIGAADPLRQARAPAPRRARRRATARPAPCA